MSIFSKFKARMGTLRRKTKVITAGLTVAIAGVAALAAVGNAAAAAISTPDCTANSVIVCGADSLATLKGRYANGFSSNGVSDSPESIHNIYGSKVFGIMSGDIKSMDASNTFTGYVTSGGDVFTGDPQGAHMLVATDALTAGRSNKLPNCTPQTCVFHNNNGTVFYSRKPSVSFVSSPLKAFVVMQDGVFQFAILNSCGNPIVAHPKKPAYAIQKQVREISPKTTSYSSNVTVPSGATVEYQITVSSTGPIPVKNVTVRDQQPNDVTYNTGTLKENDNLLASKDVSNFFGNGFLIPSINAGGKDTFTFEAQAGKVIDTDPTCKPQQDLTNTGFISAPKLGGKHDHATVNTTCTPPKVALACVGLTLTAGSVDATTGNQKYTLDATSTAKNAAITGYKFVFGDGTSATVSSSKLDASTTHTYAPGSFTANVTVLATANGKQITATSPDCQKPVNVKKPVPSSLACDSLTLTPGTIDDSGNTTYTLTAKATATNATITSYAFTFDNGTTPTPVNTGATTASTTHVYAPGTHTASVTVTGTDANGKPLTAPANSKCSVQITVKTPECKPGVPVGSPQCSPSSLTCVGLSDVPGDVDATTGDQAFAFTGQASADNATIQTYTFDFGDGNSTPVSSGANSATASHTYAPGSYTAMLTVTGQDASGNPIQAPTVKKCSVQITVKTPECKPGVPTGNEQCFVYTCNDFTVSIDNDTRTVTVASFSATSTNPNASLTSVALDWGDGTNTTVSAQDATQQTHTFSADSSTITATGLFTVDGQTSPVSSTICSQPVSFTTTPPPSQPPVLPNTGAGDTVAIFLGTVTTATIAARLFMRRKLSRR